MLLGMLLGVILYRPIFNTFLKDANINPQEAMLKLRISQSSNTTDTVVTDNSTKYITHTSTNYVLPNGISFSEKRNDTLVATAFIIYPPLSALGDNEKPELKVLPDAKPSYSSVVLTTSLKWKFVFLVWSMIIFVTMAYGPIAAFLVELFPTKIRYTSMSLPYHIGNGVFGGLVPFIATLLATTFSKDPLVGLWYPIGVAGLCFIIGALYLSNKIDKDVND